MEPRGFQASQISGCSGSLEPILPEYLKGNKAAGRMGRDTVTVQNVELVKIIADRNLMLVKGAVPGGKGQLASHPVRSQGSG